MMTTMQPEELRTIVATNIRHRRQEIGLTQTQLADKCGLAQGFISDLESARSRPHIDSLARLAEALQTTPSALLTPEIFSSRRLDKISAPPIISQR